MKKDKFYLKKLIVLFVAVIVALTGFGACSPIKEITEAAELTAQDIPSREDTIISLLEINRAMEEAMSQGETELTFNAADIGEEELKHIGDNLSTFWGKPTRYSINKEFEDVEGIIPGRSVVVRNITNYFELSSNFYVYDFIRNGTPIPDGKEPARRIANLVPGIAGEIFTDTNASDYDKTLAAHDWLVANIDYDESTPGISEENGSYGAIVLRRTMCQGYSEALELLLRCYTDVEITQMVGEALNNGNVAASEEFSESQSGEWGGHAWNAVKFEGDWYQIDTTFNDPRGNLPGQISHFYFGQTDEVMAKNHRWAAEYFPVSDTQNFLFFRKSGLFAENWDAFQTMFTGILTDNPVTSIEIAIQGARIDEENIQFIYEIRNEIEEIRWSEQIWNDICVNSIALIYAG